MEIIRYVDYMYWKLFLDKKLTLKEFLEETNNFRISEYDKEIKIILPEGDK